MQENSSYVGEILIIAYQYLEAKITYLEFKTQFNLLLMYNSYSLLKYSEIL